MSLSPMSHVEFKKVPCRPVDFRGQGPYFGDKRWVPPRRTNGDFRELLLGSCAGCKVVDQALSSGTTWRSVEEVFNAASWQRIDPQWPLLILKVVKGNGSGSGPSRNYIQLWMPFIDKYIMVKLHHSYVSLKKC